MQLFSKFKKFVNTQNAGPETKYSANENKDISDELLRSIDLILRELPSHIDPISKCPVKKSRMTQNASSLLIVEEEIECSRDSGYFE